MTTIQLLNLTAASVTLYANEKVGSFLCRKCGFSELSRTHYWTRNPFLQSQNVIDKLVELILGNVWI